MYDRNRTDVVLRDRLIELINIRSSDQQKIRSVDSTFHVAALGESSSRFPALVNVQAPKDKMRVGATLVANHLSDGFPRHLIAICTDNGHSDYAAPIWNNSCELYCSP
jgi:hypothetical protein